MGALVLSCALLCLSLHNIVAVCVKTEYIANGGTYGWYAASRHKQSRRSSDGFLRASLEPDGNRCCQQTVEPSLRTKAILLCGGTGQRMNGHLESLLNSKNPDYFLNADSPPYKQFIFMHGIPLFVYSLAEFLSSPLISEITIATKPEWNAKILEYVDSYAGTIIKRISKSCDEAPKEARESSHYENHFQKYPFFVYDLKELRCVLHDSSTWNEALEEAVKLRDCSRYKLVTLCTSGEHRALTVYNALRRRNALDVKLPGCCREDYIALVHDSVRPIARYLDIEKLVTTAQEHGAAIPAVAVTDTIKVGQKDNEMHYVKTTLDRSSLFAIQTPQAIRSSLLKRAYGNVLGEDDTAPPDSLTDDASFVELLGIHRVAIVPGHRLNMKVTTWEDIRSCSQLLKDVYFSDT
ncbi:nucleotide-diphospho-sugar transferases like protein [Babesia gibsoni]|uniref:Nucleotide-diphospho-sugar transferases like protein n=1 Tax=Babesia gibsoni TaxID=33632 RepID=A0AAD8PGW0_BABGI|nr:nucleotide-diphospho-sugar transferases like protein [Babesia gibsoni]